MFSIVTAAIEPPKDTHGGIIAPSRSTFLDNLSLRRSLRAIADFRDRDVGSGEANAHCGFAYGSTMNLRWKT